MAVAFVAAVVVVAVVVDGHIVDFGSVAFFGLVEVALEMAVPAYSSSSASASFGIVEDSGLVDKTSVEEDTDSKGYSFWKINI